MSTTDALGIIRYEEADGTGQSMSELLNDGLDSVSAAIAAGMIPRVAGVPNLASIPSPQTGMLAYVIAADTTYRYTAGVWKPWDSGWWTWTPTITNLTIGTGGTATGRARYVAGRVEHDLVIRLGTSPTMGALSLTLAVALANPSATTSRGFEGESYLMDEGVGVIPAVLLLNPAGTTILVRYWGTLNTTTPLGASAPFTWAAGDRVFVRFIADPL